MLIRRSLAVGVVFCAQALFACSAPGPEEDLAQASEPLNYTFAGRLNIRSDETVVAPRGIGLLDLFAARYLGSPPVHRVEYSRYTDATGWQAPVSLGSPGGNPRSLASCNNGGRVDLFAGAANGKVYHTVSDVPGNWSVPWYEVPGIAIKSPDADDGITVTSWAPGRLDLFWITPLGNIGHKWAVGNVWQGTETGDQGIWYLQPAAGGVYSPPIESVSYAANRLDIIVKANQGSGGMNHHYFDGVGWNRQHVPCCKRPNGTNFTFNEYVVMRSPSTNSGFELFVKDSNILQQFYYLQGWSVTNGAATADDSTQTFAFGSTTQLNDGLMWNGTRRDIFGWQPGSGFDVVWQMYF